MKNVKSGAGKVTKKEGKQAAAADMDFVPAGTLMRSSVKNAGEVKVSGRKLRNSVPVKEDGGSSTALVKVSGRKLRSNVPVKEDGDSSTALVKVPDGNPAKDAGEPSTTIDLLSEVRATVAHVSKSRTPRVPVARDPPRQVAVPRVDPTVKTVEQYEAEVLALKAEIADMKKAKGKEKVVDKGWLVDIVDKVVCEVVDRKLSNIVRGVQRECRGLKEEVKQEVMKELSNNF